MAPVSALGVGWLPRSPIFYPSTFCLGGCHVYALHDPSHQPYSPRIRHFGQAQYGRNRFPSFHFIFFHFLTIKLRLNHFRFLLQPLYLLLHSHLIVLFPLSPSNFFCFLVKSCLNLVFKTFPKTHRVRICPTFSGK